MRPYLLNRMLHGPDPLSFCMAQKIMRTGSRELKWNHTFNLVIVGGKQLSKDYINLQENFFFALKKLGFGAVIHFVLKNTQISISKPSLG